MLKIRVLPCLTIKDLRLVKSIQFKKHRNIGSYIAAVKVFNSRDVDELILLDLDARTNGIKPWLISEVSKECFMPLTIGGGVKSVPDIKKLLKLGADKVSINSFVLDNPSFIEKAANIFGSQCIVVSIDVIKNGDKYAVMTCNGTRKSNFNAVDWAKKVEKLGAGEILLTSINCEGRMQGYDLNLIKIVSSSVNVPVIAKGGAGKLEDFVLAVKNGASAVCAASIFQYTSITPGAIRKYLIKNGIEARNVFLNSWEDKNV